MTPRRLSFFSSHLANTDSSRSSILRVVRVLVGEQSDPLSRPGGTLAGRPGQRSFSKASRCFFASSKDELGL